MNRKEKTELGHIPKRYNLYYMVMDTKTGNWRDVKGALLNMPLTKEEADEKNVVTRTDGNWTFQGVLDLAPDGNPHLGITIGEELEKEEVR